MSLTSCAACGASRPTWPATRPFSALRGRWTVYLLQQMTKRGSLKRFGKGRATAYDALQLQRIQDPAGHFRMSQDIFATGFIIHEETGWERVEDG